MSINLVPPDFWRFQMSKSTVTKLVFTFNWDSLLPAPQSTPSLGGIFRGTQNAPLDCDLAVLLLNSQAKLPDSKALVSFANPTSHCKSVQHLADNLSGNNQFNKQESLQVVLETLPAWVDSLLFVVGIYEAKHRHQNFSQIKNASLTVSPKAAPTWLKLPVPTLQTAATLLRLATLQRQEASWQLTALLEPVSATTYAEFIANYQLLSS